MRLEQFANPKGHGVPEALFCRGTSPVRSSVRKSLVFGTGRGLYGNHTFSVFVAGHQTGEPSRNVRLWLLAEVRRTTRIGPLTA